MIIRLFRLGFICWLMLLNGCNAYLHQPLGTRGARIGESTSMSSPLKELPKPTDPIVAAVYSFRDQTGQYKLQELSSGFSTVVTQGATNILVKAMEDSGWFLPIERENVNNLLNERKIIRSTRAQYSEEEGPQPQLPPLLFAGVLLEGGIISYDTNILTGGAGIRYFGAGGSGQYRQDRVTVYLRAISTSNGKILKTVYVSKTILSQALDGGIFRFVSFQRLLEAETGFTFNEPSDMAVKEAIEKAVYSLIIEGIMDGLWDVPLEKAQARSLAVLKYLKEKELAEKTDLFGRVLYREKLQRVAAHTAANSFHYAGDLSNSDTQLGYEVGMEAQLLSGISLESFFFSGNLATTSTYKEKIFGADLNAKWRFLPYNRFTPYVYIGCGMLFDEDGQLEGTGRRNYLKGQFGGGVEFFLSPSISVHAGLDYNYLLNDDIDRLVRGSENDIYYRGRLGIRYFLDNKLFRK